MYDCIVISCEITFWRKSYHSIKIFRWQKKVTTIIMDCENRDCCRNLFIKRNILILMSKYILSLLIYIYIYLYILGVQLKGGPILM
jgi:hypothetical protein